MRLAEAENPTIAAARARIIEALALQTARAGLALALDQPRHQLSRPYWDLQRSAGKILNLTNQSFYFGGGAGPVVAGTFTIPMINIVRGL